MDKKCFIFAAIFFSFISLVRAQNFISGIWPSDNVQIEFKFQSPYFSKWVYYGYENNGRIWLGDYYNDYSIYLYNFNVNLPFSNKLNFVTDLGLVYFYRNLGLEGYEGSEFSETTIDNVYLGIQLANNRINSSAVNYEFGVFLPTTNPNYIYADYFAAISDFYYFPKYIIDSYSFNLTLSRWDKVNEYFEWNFEAGPVIVVPKSGRGRNTEIFGRLEIGSKVQYESLFLETEFNGVLDRKKLILDSVGELSSAIGIGLGYKLKNLTPLLFYKAKLNKTVGKYSFSVIGFKLLVEF